MDPVGDCLPVELVLMGTPSWKYFRGHWQPFDKFIGNFWEGVGQFWKKATTSQGVSNTFWSRARGCQIPCWAVTRRYWRTSQDIFNKVAIYILRGNLFAISLLEKIFFLKIQKATDSSNNHQRVFLLMLCLTIPHPGVSYITAKDCVSVK